jgi:low temperature requirement protein LtrA
VAGRRVRRVFGADGFLETSAGRRARGPLSGRVPGLGVSTTTDYPVDGGHFAERFQSFIIIVLGESLVVTGATASTRGLSAITVAALALAFAITGALWWLYFGEVAEHSRDLLAGTEDPVRLARDAYSHVHLLIVAGVIMVAVGDDLLLADPKRALSAGAVVMLAGGPALYLAGEVLFRIRMIGSVNLKRVIVTLALCVVSLVLPALPALALAGDVTGVLAVLAVWEYDALGLAPLPRQLRRVPA